MGGIQEMSTEAQQQVLANAAWDRRGPPPNETWKGHLSPSCDCGVHRHALRHLWIAVITAETRLRKRSEIFAVFTASAWVGFRTKVASWLGPLETFQAKEANVRALEERAQKALLPAELRLEERRLVLH